MHARLPMALIGILMRFQPSLLAGHHVGPFFRGPEGFGGPTRSSSHRSCMVGKKLYCGNLSYNVSSSDLDQLFSQFGTVQSAEVINDRDTGRSKGFGFVEMGSENEALEAINGMN